MSKLMLIVEDSFHLSGRGVIVTPFVSPDLIGNSEGGHKSKVRLVRPDGAEEFVEATFHWQHFKPGGFHYACYLEKGKKEQVPPKTEIWLLDAE
jgi:hypothetical protein